MVEFRVGFLEDKEAIYQDAVGLCIDFNLPTRALEYAERAKSRALLDLLAQRINLNIQARDDADRALVDELMRLRLKRDQLYRSWESDEKFTERGWISSSSDRRQAQREVLELENQITERWHKLLIHNADYARDAALWQVRTEPIQAYLSPGTVLLEYFIAHRQLIAFVVTATSVSAIRLPGEIAPIQQAPAAVVAQPRHGSAQRFNPGRSPGEQRPGSVGGSLPAVNCTPCRQVIRLSPRDHCATRAAALSAFPCAV